MTFGINLGYISSGVIDTLKGLKMSTRASITMKDYSKESSTTQVWVQDVGAGNYASVTQDIDEIKDAFATVSLGAIQSAGFRKEFPETGGFPASPAAQRESKWVITMQDTTQYLDAGSTIANPRYLDYFGFEIPCADTSLLAPNSDLMDVTNQTVIDFIAAIEANVRSPWNHSAAVTPTQIFVEGRFVGRNI